LPRHALTTGQLKAICIQHLQDYVVGFQERRAKVTDEVVDEFMKTRPLEWNGNPKVPRADLIVPTAAENAGETPADGEGGLTKSALKKQAKLEKLAKEKAEKAAAKAAKEAAEAKAK
jgi:tryptophanyl-tRNA synthetase